MTCFSMMVFALAPLATMSAAPVSQFVINLDLVPEERYAEVIPAFNESIWEFYNTIFLPNPALQALIYGVSAKRGPENSEMMGEITGMAELTQLPFEFVKSIQMQQELLSLMVPVVNFTGSPAAAPRLQFPEGYEALQGWPGAKAGGYGCTGIIARNAADGMVYHARNLDLNPPDVYNKLVYEAIFERQGVEVFRSQMMAGYTMVITAAKGLGTKEGFAVERNTRFADHVGSYMQAIGNLENGMELQGWTLRKVFEEEVSFDAAVERISTTPFVSTEFAIVSGVQQGTILGLNPGVGGVAHVAHRQMLGESNFEEPSEYIIMTNFDFYWHDIKEFFDPTAGGGFGKPSRRVAAQAILNATLAAGDPLTPELLYSVINSPFVLADTIFQVVMSVEAGLWNTSIPVHYSPPTD
eukprot:CAMPEP_0171647498 /NCGR_PEP_ID=MMETSP0990-20121206/35497_1 /TAXON_ID=483369 /ORGANISM="non described non described, Strain CCMP2098" /LENGTH=410 /DNA_ID=CAMNT_0012224743 /DNA_START=42 /DNA_END=1274 /DNA_ORIENTATION=-